MTERRKKEIEEHQKFSRDMDLVLGIVATVLFAVYLVSLFLPLFSK